MLSFKKALVLSLAGLTLFFLFRSHHATTATAPNYRNANDLPRPTAWVNPLVNDAHDKTAATQPHNTATTANQAFDLPDPVHGKPKTQLSLDERHRRPLKEQLEYQFPYDVVAKTPAFIWQTWKYTPAQAKFEELYREPEASWSILHPSFVHEVITDNVAVFLIRHLYASVPDVLDAYHALPLPVLKADFFRYLILLARGGIYSDIDTQALKPAAEWVPSNVPASSYGMVIGIEADPDRPDWHDWYSRRLQFCQWTIQAKPGHPILVDIVANITQETLNRKRAGKLSKNTNEIVEFTGPAVWTDTIFAYLNNPEFFDMTTSSGNITWENFTGMKAPKKVGDIIVLPITSFSPGIKTMGAGEPDDPMAFVKHMFEGTWKPENERHLGEIFE